MLRAALANDASGPGTPQLGCSWARLRELTCFWGVDSCEMQHCIRFYVAMHQAPRVFEGCGVSIFKKQPLLDDRDAQAFELYIYSTRR